MLVRSLLCAFVLALLIACSSSDIPPVDQFSTPAVGLAIPDIIPQDPLVLPEGDSGVLFVNRTSLPVRVAVNETIAEIPVNESFLFVLPPGSHRFFIYETDANPKDHVEQTEAGKIRYVYLIPTPR